MAALTLGFLIVVAESTFRANLANATTPTLGPFFFWGLGIYLAVVALRTASAKATHEDVEVSGLYWHFVDLVWMFVFPLVYLLSVQG